MTSPKFSMSTTLWWISSGNVIRQCRIYHTKFDQEEKYNYLSIFGNYQADVFIYYSYFTTKPKFNVLSTQNSQYCYFYISNSFINGVTGTTLAGCTFKNPRTSLYTLSKTQIFDGYSLYACHFGANTVPFTKSKSLNPTHRFSSSKTVKPTHKFSSSKTVKATKTVKPSKTVKQSKTVKPSKTVKASKTVKPSNTVKSSRKFTYSANLNLTNQFTESSQFTKSSSFTSSKTVKPSKTVKSTVQFTKSSSFTPSDSLKYDVYLVRPGPQSEFYMLHGQIKQTPPKIQSRKISPEVIAFLTLLNLL